MELDEFVEMLGRLNATEMQAVAAAIDASHQTAADEVEAWEDLMRIDDALRSRGRTRAGARAAHEATQAVRAAAGQTGVEISASLVTRVAREAALLARALVAGADEPVAHLAREFAVSDRSG